ncbi:fatty acid desaturase [Nostoc linckia FACHB-104]|nr:fatty acid desaturase [Nostoc linckia FACHB-104]
MLSLHYGCHESVHSTLIPRTWKGSTRANFILGCIGFAVFGHNYLLMRWSHNYHHICGRLHRNCTIDMTDGNRGIIGRVSYYFSLFGASAVVHELAGYVYPFLPARAKSLAPWFQNKNFKSKLFVKCQLLVFFITLLLIYLGGFYFLICRLLFLPLWGLGQNVAHYGLPVGQGEFPEFSARTYRVNSFISFFLYGGGFYHFEHHVMPNVPGLLLWHPSVSAQIEARLGFSPLPQIGLSNYLKDIFRQFSGPYLQK